MKPLWATGGDAQRHLRWLAEFCRAPCLREEDAFYHERQLEELAHP